MERYERGREGDREREMERGLIDSSALPTSHHREAGGLRQTSMRSFRL